MKTTKGLFTGLLLLLAAQVSARELTTRSNAAAPERRDLQTEQLAQAKQTFAQRAFETKGAQRQDLMLEQRKVDRLIDDLRAGRSVDPSEVDRVLEHAQQSR